MAPVTLPTPPGLEREGALNTSAMWVYSLIPALNIVALVALTAVAALLVSTHDAGLSSVGLALDSQGVTLGITILLLVARVLLAREDHRALSRPGVLRPMAWGWGLLPGVYAIGRGVVLDRRVGRGAMLTWISLAVMVISLVVDRSGIYDAVAAVIIG